MQFTILLVLNNKIEKGNSSFWMLPTYLNLNQQIVIFRFSQAEFILWTTVILWIANVRFLQFINSVIIVHHNKKCNSIFRSPCYLKYSKGYFNWTKSYFHTLTLKGGYNRTYLPVLWHLKFYLLKRPLAAALQ